MGGYATENWIGYSHGHDWVIDGYKDVYRVWGVYNNFYDENYNLIRQEPAGERKEQETRWLHCNYGWGGTGNGYYYGGVQYRVPGRIRSKLRKAEQLLLLPVQT